MTTWLITTYLTRVKERCSLPTLLKIEEPTRRTREGGSEWEPIKILLEGEGDSNKTNMASNTRLHVATGVLLNLGTTFQPHRPENATEHQPQDH
jgi:hypothetical protein